MFPKAPPGTQPMMISCEFRRSNTHQTSPDCCHRRGTAEYGDPEDDSQPWSVLWTGEAADEFLFASGNIKYWLVVSREELIGIENDDFVSLPLLASSEDQPSQGKNLDLSPSKSRSVFSCIEQLMYLQYLVTLSVCQSDPPTLHNVM